MFGFSEIYIHSLYWVYNTLYETSFIEPSVVLVWIDHKVPAIRRVCKSSLEYFHLCHTALAMTKQFNFTLVIALENSPFINIGSQNQRNQRRQVGIIHDRKENQAEQCVCPGSGTHMEVQAHVHTALKSQGDPTHTPWQSTTLSLCSYLCHRASPCLSRESIWCPTSLPGMRNAN